METKQLLVNEVKGLTSEVETGMTLDDLYSKQARSMERLDYDSTIKDLQQTLLKFMQDKPTNSYFMLNSKFLNYMTIFKNEVPSRKMAMATEVADFLLSDSYIVDELGGLKMYSDEDNDFMIEFYIGDKHFAFFPCDHLIINV